MARTMVVLVGDESRAMRKNQDHEPRDGMHGSRVYPKRMGKKSERSKFTQPHDGEVPALSVGMNPITEGAKILQFPQPSLSSDDDKKVRTINELESIAIENAIHEFGGNLTEAAKALGIGRATLYRKVKQYNIDPSSARKKRAA